MLKSIKTKKKAKELLEGMKPYLSTEGIELVDYYIKEIATFKLGELKKSILKDFAEKDYAKDDDGRIVIDDMLYGDTTENAEQPKVEEPKDEKSKEEEPKDDNKPLSEKEIIQLVGYRYTRPVFPKEIKDDMLFKDIKLVRVDLENPAEIKNLGLDNLIVATFFPSWDNTIMVDPVDVSEVPYTTILKKKGRDSFPYDLDLAQIYYLNAENKTMAYVSMYTKLPYAVSIRPKWFTVHPQLHCRVNNYGHDYAIYQAVSIKK